MLPYISTPFEYAAGQIGASSDDLKQVGTFLFAYPLAGLLKRVPDARPAYKNLFVISVSLFYLIGLFDLWDGLAKILFSAGGAYAIAAFLRKSPYMPWVGFVFLMGHLSFSHLARQIVGDPGKADITGVQMVMVMKLTAFCWNVFDGTLPDDQLSDFQKERRLVELPGLLDYAGYIFFFPSLFAGPAFDFAEYRRWLDCSMFDVPASVDPTKKPPTRRKRKIPRSATPALLKGAQGLLYLGGYIYLMNYFDWPVLLSPEYVEYGFLRRVWIMYMVNVSARFKYYGSWFLTEGACILTGLGYNGLDPITGKISWNRLQNVDPLGVELAQNSRAYLDGWNKNTNKWLRYYVYLRVTPRGKKPGFRASLATFTTSAFWHGFHPGYYLTFILAAFVQTVAKNFRRYCRPFFLDPKTQKPLATKKYYDFFSYLATQLVFCYATTPFLTLSLAGSLEAWQRVYYYAVVGVAVSMALFASPAKRHLKKTLEKRAAKAGVSLKPGEKASGATTTGSESERPDMLHRTTSTDSISGRAPILGMSQDPEQELDEAVDEIKSDFEAAKAEFEAKKAEFEAAMAKKSS